MPVASLEGKGLLAASDYNAGIIKRINAPSQEILVKVCTFTTSDLNFCSTLRVVGRSINSLCYNCTLVITSGGRAKLYKENYVTLTPNDTIPRIYTKKEKPGLSVYIRLSRYLSADISFLGGSNVPQYILEKVSDVENLTEVVMQ